MEFCQTNNSNYTVNAPKNINQSYKIPNTNLSEVNCSTDKILPDVACDSQFFCTLANQQLMDRYKIPNFCGTVPCVIFSYGPQPHHSLTPIKLSPPSAFVML